MAINNRSNAASLQQGFDVSLQQVRNQPELSQQVLREATSEANTMSETLTDLRDGIDPGDPLTKKGRIKKRKQGSEETDPDPNDPERYRYKAYHIRRAFSLYGHLPSIINDGIKRRAKAAAMEDITGVQSEQDYQTFLSIVNHLEGFEEDISRLKHHPKVFRKLVRKIREAADQARNNDTANLKRDIASMLTHDGQSVLRTVRKGMKASSKNDRGFENDIMGKYLCPVSLDWDDPCIREEIRDGKHAILACDWPRLLYANLECDFDDMELGLGRNIALVRVVKYLFTGRSSAFSDTPGGKTTCSGNAALAGMTEITPKVIAYGACMLRFAISNEESWTKVEKEFHMEEFYWNVVNIFDESGEFGKELLAWWNQQVFGTSQETSAAESNSVTTSCLSLLKNQRAAKRARLCFASTGKENENPRPNGDAFQHLVPAPLTYGTSTVPRPPPLQLHRSTELGPPLLSSLRVGFEPGHLSSASARHVLPSEDSHHSSALLSRATTNLPSLSADTVQAPSISGLCLPLPSIHTYRYPPVSNGQQASLPSVLVTSPSPGRTSLPVGEFRCNDDPLPRPRSSLSTNFHQAFPPSTLFDVPPTSRSPHHRLDFLHKTSASGPSDRVTEIAGQLSTSSSQSLEFFADVALQRQAGESVSSDRL